jgi:hypothetical protein
MKVVLAIQGIVVETDFPQKIKSSPDPVDESLPW